MVISMRFLKIIVAKIEAEYTDDKLGILIRNKGLEPEQNAESGEDA